MAYSVHLTASPLFLFESPERINNLFESPERINNGIKLATGGTVSKNKDMGEITDNQVSKLFFNKIFLFFSHDITSDKRPSKSCIQADK